MKKTFILIAALILLATPALADNQPADSAPANSQSAATADTGDITLKMMGVNVKLGGFLAAEGVYRARNENSDISSKFNAIPLPNSVGYYQDETRFSARQSRLNILAQGDYSPTIHLAGFYEMDFLGAASTANSQESNSYNPRIRHLYSTIDWDNLGLHLLGGQTWSLVTMNNHGITPRQEDIPLTIEAQYVPGFSWARQPQLRIVKDWNKTYWLAVSFEMPQTVAASTPNTVGTNSSLGQSGGGSLTGVSVSANTYPDLILKAAYDPGWIHFEIFNLTRTFKSTLQDSNSNVNGDQLTTTAGGMGVILPLFSKQLNLQVSGMYGEGIGRYGSGQLPDVTQSKDGQLSPITELQLLAGVNWTPTSSLTIYGYYGWENAERRDLATGGLAYGYGSILDDVELGLPGTTIGKAFNGQINSIDQFTIGAWWKFFQGKFGNVQAGLQYSYTKDTYFSGTYGSSKIIASGPVIDDSMVLSSLRFNWK
ncbi:MAG: hypothetical protein ABSC11_12840 [Smithella sp.]|jgi:hypothetical protein